MAVVEKVRAVEMTALTRGFTHFKFSVLFVLRIVLIIYGWQFINTKYVEYFSLL